MQFNDEITLMAQAFLEKQSIADYLIEFFKNDDFFEELSSLSCELLYKKIKYKFNLSEFNKAIIVVSLVNIALTKYSNGNFYSPVRLVFKKCYEEYNEQTIDKHIREILQPYKSFVKYSDPSSYVAVPLVACVVPHYRLNHLFNIAFDIYKKNLRLDPDITNIQIQQKISQIFDAFVRKDLINSTEDGIRGTNYWMSTFTQTCIKERVYLDDLITITSNCIELIKNYIWNDEFKNEKPFYEEAFLAWKSIYDKEEKTKIDKNTLISRARFSLVADHLFLTTKAISISDQFDPNNLYVVINGQKFDIDDVDYGQDNDTVGDELIINEKTIDLKKIKIDSFSDLKYSIYCGEEEIFSSEDSLNRDVIFFSALDKKEIKPGTDFEGDMICISKELLSIKGATILYRNENYIITQFFVKSDDTFLIGNKVYMFCSTKGYRIISQPLEWIYFKDITNDRCFDIYNSFEGILFDTSLEKDEILIYDLNRQNNDIEIILNKSGSNHINSFFLKTSSLEEGYHSLEIVSKINHKQVKSTKIFEFVLDHKISKNVILGDDSAIVTVESSLIEEKAYDYNYLQNEIVVNGYIKNFINGQFHINPEIFLYSLDNINWKLFKNRIYFNDIKNYSKSIYVKGFNHLECTFKAETEKQLNVESGENKNEFIVYLGGLLTYKDQEHITLKLKSKINIEQLFIDFVPLINFSMSYKKYIQEKNIHEFCCFFSGSSKIMCKIYESSPSNPVYNFIIESGKIFNPVGLEPFKKYKVGLFIKTFGLLFDFKPFYVGEYFYYDSRRLAGRSYMICGAEVEQIIKHATRINEIDLKNNNWFLRIVSSDRYNYNNQDCYFGFIYNEKSSKYQSNNSIKNIAIKILGFRDESHIWVEVKQYLIKEIKTAVQDAKRDGQTFTFDPNDPDYSSLVMFDMLDQKFVEETRCATEYICFLEKILISL